MNEEFIENEKKSSFKTMLACVPKVFSVFKAWIPQRDILHVLWTDEKVKPRHFLCMKVQYFLKFLKREKQNQSSINF